MVMLRAISGPLSGTVRRAPVATLAAVVMTAAFYAAVHGDLTDRQAELTTLAALAAFLGAVVGQLARGSLAALVLSASAGAAVAFEAALLVSVPLLLAGLALGTLAAPLLAGGALAIEAWRRLVRTTTAAALGLLGALVVTAGVFLAEISVKTLLALDVGDVTTDLVAPAAAGLLAPLVFLTLAMPEVSGADDRVSDALGMVAQTFARLVLTPLLSIYTLVLSAYVVRILVEGGLPSNEVGWIVPLFCGAGVLTFLALAAAPEAGRVSRSFVRFWFPITLAPLVLYGVAVAMRLTAYGLTPERYGLVLVGAVFAILALAFTIGGSRSDVRLVPVTAALVVALGGIGPWSLEPTVRHSQGRRVMAIFEGGDVAARLRAMDDGARQRACSHVRALADVGGIGPIEAALGAKDPGLQALCLEPYGTSDPDDVIDFDVEGDVLALPDGRLLWGPVFLPIGGAPVAARSEDLALEIAGTTLLARMGDRAVTFDLVSAAEAWRRAGDERAGMTLSASGISVIVRRLFMVLDDDAPALRSGTVFVLADPSAAPFGEGGPQ